MADIAQNIIGYAQNQPKEYATIRTLARSFVVVVPEGDDDSEIMTRFDDIEDAINFVHREKFSRLLPARERHFLQFACQESYDESYGAPLAMFARALSFSDPQSRCQPVRSCATQLVTSIEETLSRPQLASLIKYPEGNFFVVRGIRNPAQAFNRLQSAMNSAERSGFVPMLAAEEESWKELIDVAYKRIHGLAGVAGKSGVIQVYRKVT